tara:strand:- start:8660 stop:9376 length:717 start_codon:yes stop_codon:yes gene_type:complete
MAKSDKKIIRQINKRASIEGLKKNTAYRDPKSGRYYITDSKGRFKDFTTEEGAIAYKEKQEYKKEVDKKMKSHFVDLEVQAKKKPLSEKERLKELKNNPEVVREELDKMYDDFLKTKKEADLALSNSPEERILLRKQKRIGQNIYKKSNALSNLTGGNEWQEAYEVITGKTFDELRQDKAEASVAKEQAMTEKGFSGLGEKFGTSTRPPSVEDVKKTIPSPYKEYTTDELFNILKKSK